jgi:hypothetical protein
LQKPAGGLGRRWTAFFLRGGRRADQEQSGKSKANPHIHFPRHYVFFILCDAQHRPQSRQGAILTKSGKAREEKKRSLR